MVDYNTPITIAHVTDAAGLPVGRITAQRDIYYPGTPAQHLSDADSPVTIKVIAGPRGTSEEYFEHEATATDAPLLAAWERYTDPYTGVWEDEAIERFTRYAGVFHPFAPIITETVQTGYSQGDWVTLIAWVEPERVKSEWGDHAKTAYHAAYSAHECAQAALDLAGQLARGQVYTVTYEEVSAYTFEQTDEDGDQATGTLTVEYTYAESFGGYIAESEFDPERELIDCARSDLMPDGPTIIPAE